MTLTSEIEEKGLKAYEQARAFERLKAWRFPIIYGIMPMVPMVLGIILLEMDYAAGGWALIIASGAISYILWSNWTGLRERHVENLMLLEELEKTYGDQLPWVQVNKHFAELEKLQREIAEEKGK